MLYCEPSPLTLAPHTSVAPYAGIRTGVLRNLMILALPYALGRCGMTTGELRVGKGGLLIIMPRQLAVNYRFSRKNDNLILLPFSRCRLCASRATNSVYILTLPGVFVCSSIHFYYPLLTSASAMQPPSFVFISPP
jgi:hypothetical protein